MLAVVALLACTGQVARRVPGLRTCVNTVSQEGI